jgi:hypothetical protein
MAGEIREKSMLPKEGRYIFCPECGGEVYEGESLYRFGFGDTAERYICGHCLVQAVSGLRPEDIAFLTGSRETKVSFARGFPGSGAETAVRF